MTPEKHVGNTPHHRAVAKRIQRSLSETLWQKVQVDEHLFLVDRKKGGRDGPSDSAPVDAATGFEKAFQNASKQLEGWIEYLARSLVSV